jgi:hypothetical protein
MQNKNIRNSNMKIKKEEIIQIKDIKISNPNLTNINELSKHKSLDFYNSHSPKEIRKDKKDAQSNKYNSNTNLGITINQTTNLSGIKVENNRKSCFTKMSKFKNINKYNIQNSNEIIKRNSKQIESNIDKNNKKVSNYKNNASEKNIRKKSDEINNVLSESDSFQEIDSAEEGSPKENEKKNTKNNNSKLNNNDKGKKGLNKNCENSKTSEQNNIKKINSAIYNKQQNDKGEIKKNIENADDSDEIIIINDEFGNLKNNQINNMNKTKFPKLAINPFINSEKNCKKENGSKNINSVKNNNIIKLKEPCNKEEKEKKKEKEKDNLNTDQQMKSSNFNNKSITTQNSSNLSNIIQIMNNKTTEQNKKDIDKNYKNLLLAAKNGEEDKFLEIFKQIEKNLCFPELVNINYKDEKGYTALHYACDEGKLKIVEILLDEDCDPNIKNNEKETPLHLASKKGYFDICKILIENGAVLNTYNSEKNSPLHYACMNNNVELLKYFLTKLPQADAKNKHGEKPIDLTKNKEIKTLLQNYLKNNENKYNNLTIYQTTDFKMNILIEHSHEELPEDIKVKNRNKMNVSLSPNQKQRSKIGSKKEFNNIQEIFGCNIIKKNTIPKNFGFKSSNAINLYTENYYSTQNSGQSLQPSNAQNPQKNTNSSNINSNLKKNEIKKSGKLQDKRNSYINSIRSKKDQNSNIKKIMEETSLNNNTNELTKKKTIEKFNTSSKFNINDNRNSLYNCINKGYINLDDSKVNNLNNHEKVNQSYNKIDINRNNGNKKLNNSVNKFNRDRKIINENGNILPQNKSKFFESSQKNKNNLLDSIDISGNKIANLNKTEESISSNQKKIKISKTSLKKPMSNTLKNITNSKILHTTEKILTKNTNKKKSKKDKNIDNSFNNISKISCGQNKNSMMLDSINKSNIEDQTLAENIHNKLNLNSIEEEIVTPSSFVCLALLGKGSFGEVFLVQKINTKEKFAMKVLRKERIMGQNLLKYALAERNVLSLSHHPFIVKLNYAFQTSTKLFLILEYCPNGDLAKHLMLEKRFSEPRAKFYICEVLLALENLHQRDIIFRDLKPDNVVLDKDGHCKLTDFGLSKEGVNENQFAQSFCGSIAYLAPEMLKKKGHGKAVDWYLLGVLFYEMLIGITPYFTGRKEDIFHNIEFGELKIPNFVSPEAAEILRRLLERDPNKRLGGSIKDAQEIKEHPYFKDVDWDKVYNKQIRPPTIKNYNNKMMHVYHKPRLFANDDLFRNSDNMLNGWSFINNDDF